MADEEEKKQKPGDFYTLKVVHPTRMKSVVGAIKWALAVIVVVFMIDLLLTYYMHVRPFSWLF